MADRDILVVNGQILVPSGVIEKGYVRVVDGKIQDIGTGEPREIGHDKCVIDAEGNFVLPGFIDIHVNGGGGHMSTEATPEAIRAIAAAHARYGTTSMLITTITAKLATLKRTVEVAAEVSQDGFGGAEILGVHLEGPFLNPAKAGAHKKDCLMTPSIATFDDLFAGAKGMLRMISLAPELEGGIELTRHASEKDVVVSLAHSDADFFTTLKAIDAGMTVCAHLFNAMPPLAHRAPGPVGAFLTTSETYVELISDGYHVHPAVMEITIAAKGPDHVILVTDAVSPAGTEMRTFSIDGIELEVRGKTCFTPGGHLAGSALTMNEAVKVVAGRTSSSFEEAVRMASLNPATALGLHQEKGSLEVGKDGDLVIATEDLGIIRTVVGGISVFP